jgi:ribosomal protein S27AE
MTPIYSRDSFERQRAKAKGIERGLGRMTAAVAVVLGVGQLLFIRLVAHRLAKDKALTFEIALFIPYIVVVAFMVWQLDRQVTSARPRCPQCGVSFKGVAEGVVVATGKCSACGAQVIADAG